MRKITYWLSLVLIFTIPWENVVTFSSVGGISRILGLVVSVFWVVTVLVTGRFRKPHFFHFSLYLFIIWNLLTVFWSVDIDKSIDRVQTYIQLFVFVTLLWDLYETPSALKVGLQAYVLGAYISIIGTINNFNQSKIIYYNRYAASGFNPNDLGIILALGIPVAWYLLLTDGYSKNYFLKLVNFIYLPAATYAIALTVSRSALISVAFSLLFIVFSMARLRLPIYILVSTIIVGLIFAAPNYIPRSSFDVFERKLDSLNERDVIWRAGLTIFSQHPIVGVGSDAFSTANKENGKHAHNIFLALLTETGIIGFCLFIFMLAAVANQFKFLPKWEAIFLLTVLIIWLVGASTQNLEARKQTWLFLCFLVAFGNYWQKQPSGFQESRKVIRDMDIIV